MCFVYWKNSDQEIIFQLKKEKNKNKEKLSRESKTKLEMKQIKFGNGPTFTFN